MIFLFVHGCQFHPSTEPFDAALMPLILVPALQLSFLSWWNIWQSLQLTCLPLSLVAFRNGCIQLNIRRNLSANK